MAVALDSYTSEKFSNFCEAKELPDLNQKNTDDQPSEYCERIEDQSDSTTEDKRGKQDFKESLTEHIVCGKEINKSFITNLANIFLSHKEIIELELRDCGLNEKSLQLLNRDNAGECKVTKLTIGYTDNAREHFSDICKFVKEWGITKLSLEYDSLNTKDIKYLRDCLAEEKVGNLSEIDISYNKDICSDGFKVLGETMCLHHITTLRAANCDITGTKLKGLSVGSKRVTELDLAGNKTMTAKGFKNLALFITAKDVKCLNLSGCQLTTKSVRLFCDTLIKSSESLWFVDLDVSYNPVLKPEAYKYLGSMISKCGVKKISLAGCGLDKYSLRQLRKPIKRKKVESLEVADNASIGKGIIEIAKIVGEWNLKILDMSDCMLTADNLKKFSKELRNAKPSLIRLDLSDFDRTPDEEYITELCEIIPYVAEELRAQFRILEIFLQQLMQKKLNSSANTKLKIIWNNDDDPIIWQGNKDKDP